MRLLLDLEGWFLTSSTKKFNDFLKGGKVLKDIYIYTYTLDPFY